jgi:hypothetical protein
MDGFIPRFVHGIEADARLQEFQHNIRVSTVRSIQQPLGGRNLLARQLSRYKWWTFTGKLTYHFRGWHIREVLVQFRKHDAGAFEKGMKSDDPSSVSELRARCESDNPLEVYYDVIDAFYFVLEPELPDVLSCLQIGPWLCLLLVVLWLIPWALSSSAAHPERSWFLVIPSV